MKVEIAQDPYCHLQAWPSGTSSNMQLHPNPPGGRKGISFHLGTCELPKVPGARGEVGNQLPLFQGRFGRGVMVTSGMLPLTNKRQQIFLP